MASAQPLPVPATAAAGTLERIRALVELTKPGITRMVLVTTAAGFYMASAGGMDWLRFVSTLVGVGLVASGASALNQWFEWDADGRMLRTRRRPVPSGRISRPAAFVFAILLASLGGDWLFLAVGPAPAIIVAVSLLSYVFLYTPLKRRTWWATIIGALPGALPILAGWTAAGRGVDATGLALFGILFLWQMPHFYALAWLYREDYVRGGFRMLSADDATGARTAWQAFLFALALLPVSVLPTWFGVSGTPYLIGAVVLGVAYASLGAGLVLRRTNRRAWQLFFGSVVYLPALLILMVVDKLVA